MFRSLIDREPSIGSWNPFFGLNFGNVAWVEGICWIGASGSVLEISGDFPPRLIWSGATGVVLNPMSYLWHGSQEIQTVGIYIFS